VQLDLQTENYTSLLWLFEGVTSYYDDLMLVRSGIISETTYLNLVSKSLNAVLCGAGRFKQSLAESSFDAWTKYYRQDENSPNAIVSYYTKGSLLALALDLTIRSNTAGKKSLDDLMRALWKEFGRDFYALGLKGDQKGVTAEQVEAMVDQLCVARMKPFFDQYVRGTSDIPLNRLFTNFGIDLVDRCKTKKPVLGVKLTQENSDCKLAQVFHGGAAHVAGMSAGDVIMAIDNLRVSAKDIQTNLSHLLDRYEVGTTVLIHAFRRDELRQFHVCLQSNNVPDWILQTQNEVKNKTKNKTKNKHSALLPRPSFVKT
jgi:predicted metalloprotease with PDZ domain